MPYASGGGADIYYEIHGQRNADRHVRRHGRQRIVLDTAGRGACAAPPGHPLRSRRNRPQRDDAPPRSIAGMADDIAHRARPGRHRAAHVVGHAIGGIVGIELALRDPQRLRSLVVVNGWGRADPFLRRCFEIRKQILNQSGPRPMSARSRCFFIRRSGFPATSRSSTRKKSASSRIFRPSATMNAAHRHVSRLRPRRGDWRPSTTPTLLASAKDDNLVPAYLSQQLAAAIPGARVHEVEWGAHAFTVVTPDVFNDMLLGFCREVDA